MQWQKSDKYWIIIVAQLHTEKNEIKSHKTYHKADRTVVIAKIHITQPALLVEN